MSSLDVYNSKGLLHHLFTEIYVREDHVHGLKFFGASHVRWK